MLNSWRHFVSSGWDLLLFFRLLRFNYNFHFTSIIKIYIASRYRSENHRTILSLRVFFCNHRRLQSVLEEGIKAWFRQKLKSNHRLDPIRTSERSNNYLGWNSTRSKMIFWWLHSSSIFFPLDDDSHNVLRFGGVFAASQDRLNDFANLMLNFLRSASSEGLPPTLSHRAF